MALKGQAKTDYQREYMKDRRKRQVVRPLETFVLDPLQSTTSPIREGGNAILPQVDADGNPIPEY